jgi:hypothetical protein
MVPVGKSCMIVPLVAFRTYRELQSAPAQVGNPAPRSSATKSMPLQSNGVWSTVGAGVAVVVNVLDQTGSPEVALNALITSPTGT